MSCHDSWHKPYAFVHCSWHLILHFAGSSQDPKKRGDLHIGAVPNVTRYGEQTERLRYAVCANNLRAAPMPLSLTFCVHVF